MSIIHKKKNNERFRLTSPLIVDGARSVHLVMYLPAYGPDQWPTALIKAEREHGADCVRLANAISVLYPVGSKEKRLLDAMCSVVPR